MWKQKITFTTEALVFNFELQEHAEVQIENAQQELNFAV